MIHFPYQYSPFDVHGLVMGVPSSLDGTRDDRFRIDDVAEVVAERCSGNQFDGDARFVVRLADGRFAAWWVSYENGEPRIDSLFVAREARVLEAELGVPSP